MPKPVYIVWHRSELRTHDHPALHNAELLAAETGGIVVPVVIIDDEIFGRADLTPRRQAHFLENVRELRKSYTRFGAELVVRTGKPVQELRKLADELGNVKSLHFINNYTPYAKKRDAEVTNALEELGITVRAYGGQYTHEPGEVIANNGNRYGVFGPYRKKWVTLDKPEILLAPKSLPALPNKIRLGDIPLVKSDIELPQAGEDAARKRLEWFLENGERTYDKTRDQPGLEESSSKLSYYFNIGVLSPRLAHHECRTQKWSHELTWWDFYADVMERCPQSTNKCFRENWEGFPWRSGKDKKSKADLERWKAGETGFPIVDAGMRELNRTGFMHNRVRMICASFLTKHLLIDWRVGEEIFRSLLLCGDRAQNVGNWQWVAGCGVDPSPYFRVFNPTSQGEKSDPEGHYVKRWIPELEDVEKKFIYTPHENKSGTDLKGYPKPMLDLAEGRDEFLTTARKFLKGE
jgi:deoxyribodipyrimidine photo-lyase